MSHSTQKNSFFGGAAILAAGIVVVKLIGALYKIPLFALIGDEGTGHFNNAYVIYNLLLMVSTAGLPVALSKSISEANTLGRRNQVHRIFNVALATFCVLGSISFFVMYRFAQPLATWQGDGLAYHAVLALAPACLFVCILSTFRGYAQGHGNMIPTSVSQIIEAVGKLIIGLGLAWFLVQQGARGEDSAAGAIFGVTMGALISLFFLVIDHIRRRKKEDRTSEDTPDGHGAILKRLMVIAIPITIGASVMPITTWLDTVQIQNILRNLLEAQPAQWYKVNDVVDPVVSMYGAYQKAITVYNLPSSFMVALTASVIPAISACRARQDHAGAGRIAESSLRMATLIACPAGIGLSVLATPIMYLLYPDTNHAVADSAMVLLGISSIFVCLMFLGNSVLQANGFFNLPIVVMAIGCVAKLTINYVVVSSCGIIGAPVGTLSCYATIAILELILIKRVVPAPPRYSTIFIKPIIATGAMGVAVWWTRYFMIKLLTSRELFLSEAFHFSKTGWGLITLISIGVGVLVYGVLVILLRAISRDDLALMPKGDKIAKFLHIPK